MFFTVSLAQRGSWGWAVELGALGGPLSDGLPTCGCQWDPVVRNGHSPQTSLLFCWRLLGLEGGALALKPGVGARMPGITWNPAWGALPTFRARTLPWRRSPVLSADGCGSALRTGLPIPSYWLTLLLLPCQEESLQLLVMA